MVVIVAFVAAILKMRHETRFILLFSAALLLFAAGLFCLAREVRIALTDFDHHG
jgi:hypothetical protein